MRRIHSFSILALLVISIVTTSILGSCRVGQGNCSDDKGCWSGSTNSSVPDNCKCCTGFPFLPNGECRRDCSRNSALYLLQLQDRLSQATAMENGNGICSSNKNGFVVNGWRNK